MATPSEPSISNRYHSINAYGQPQDWVPVYNEDGDTPLAIIISEYNESRYFKFDDFGKSVDWMWGVGNNVGDLLQISHIQMEMTIDIR